MCKDLLSSVSLCWDLVAQTCYFPQFLRHWLFCRRIPNYFDRSGVFFFVWGGGNTTFLNSLWSPGLHSFLCAAVDTLSSKNAAAQRILSTLKWQLATDQINYGSPRVNNGASSQHPPRATAKDVSPLAFHWDRPKPQEILVETEARH